LSAKTTRLTPSRPELKADQGIDRFYAAFDLMAVLQGDLFGTGDFLEKMVARGVVCVREARYFIGLPAKRPSES
jgi:hypothetical protein